MRCMQHRRLLTNVGGTLIQRRQRDPVTKQGSELQPWGIPPGPASSGAGKHLNGSEIQDMQFISQPPGLTCVASRKTSRSGDKKVRKPALKYPLRSLLTDSPKVV